jgi:hypothetical protein
MKKKSGALELFVDRDEANPTTLRNLPWWNEGYQGKALKMMESERQIAPAPLLRAG